MVGNGTSRSVFQYNSTGLPREERPVESGELTLMHNTTSRLKDQSTMYKSPHIGCLADTAIPLWLRVHLLLHSHPQLIGQPARTIAEIVMPHPIDRNKVQMVNSALKHLRDHPPVMDLPDENRRKLRDAAGRKKFPYANPSYLADKTARMPLPPVVMWKGGVWSWNNEYLQQTDLPEVAQFWKSKLPAALANSNWKAEPDEPLRMAGYLAWLQQPKITPDWSRISGIGYILSGDKVHAASPTLVTKACDAAAGITPIGHLNDNDVQVDDAIDDLLNIAEGE